MNPALHHLVRKRMVELRLQGMSTRKIAETLNQENLRAQKWGKWHHPTVLKEMAAIGLDPSSPGVAILAWSGELPLLGSFIDFELLGVRGHGQVLDIQGSQVWIRSGKEGAK